MTPEQLRQRNWAAQILAPTARDVVPPTEDPPDAASAHAAPAVQPANEPAAADADAPEAPASDAPATADESFWSAAAEPAAVVAPLALPVADTTEVHKRIMSVARATERCARVLSGLAERVDALDVKVAAQGPVAAEPAPDRPELALMSDQIGRLAAEVAQTHARLNERFTATDAVQAELAALASDVGGVQERLDEVVRMQRVQQTGMSSSPVVQSMQRSLTELRGELATVGSRLVGLDARLDELQSLPARMEDVAARQFQRLVPEMLTVPGDLEGVYRELERIAERMAAREEAVAQVLARVAAVEEAVTGLRLDVDRVIGGLAAVREAEAHTRDWRVAMEHRLAALEAPGSEIERLYLALDRMVGERAAVPAPDVPNGAPLSGAPPPGPPGEGTPDNERAVEALTAELERIRRSIEVLVRPGARPPPGSRDRR
ncbi:MAG TPA: hypothetical protein VHG90_16290 [Acidimicrobiales bacterium]|nr:hypothetical protein [Acidimicrobiales bacterium]